MTSNKNDRISVEELRQTFSYDPATGFLYWKSRPWVPNSANAALTGKRAGTERKGYVQIKIRNASGQDGFYGGHRIAWALHYGEWPTSLIDHIDGDRMNNRIHNLRDCNHSENSAHKRELRGKVGYKGVYYFSRDDKFAAQIKNEGSWKWLGLHDTAKQAALAYDCAANQLHGEYAITNEKLGLL